MCIKEYGKENEKVIILLHAGGVGTWNYDEVANILKSRFHVIIPSLNGHRGSKNRFSTIKENAKNLVEFIDKKLEGEVYLIGGVSLGGQILLEMLAEKKDICKFAIIESTTVLPMPFTSKLIKPVFSLCFPLIKKEWFAKLQFKSLHIKPSYFEEYFIGTSTINKEDMIAFLKENTTYKMPENLSKCTAKTLILTGSKERPIIKKSAKIINRKIKNSSMEILQGYYHGDLSLNHAKIYVEKLLKLINEEL